MIKITIQYEEKGKTPGVFIVNPDFYREISGEDLVEVLSKLLIEVTKLQRDIFEDKMTEMRMMNDDIPF